MSISSSTRKAGPYIGDGIVTALPFTFKVFATNEVKVVQTDAAGVETTRTLTADYTVTLNADQDTSPGGTVTMLVAPAVGYSHTITSTVAETQGVTLTNAGGFYPTVINDALDRLTILVQQLSTDIAGALKVGITDTIGNIPAESLRSDMGLGFDSNGDPIAIPLTSIANAIPITEKAAALGVATLDASARPLQSLAALNGKAISIAADTNLEAWADGFPAAGLYDIDLTVAQGNLPIGKWYIELSRYSSDTSGTVYHSIRATALTGTANVIYLNTSIAGTWSGWEKAKGLASLNGKAIPLTADTNLQTWADTLPESGLYDIFLNVAQGNLYTGWWYIELSRSSVDSSGNRYNSMRATAMTGTANVVYMNTNIFGTWSGWKDTRALGDGQTWKDKTGTYLNHVTYTNNYGRTIALFARVESTAGGAFGIDTYINGFDAVKQTQYATGALYHAISFVIVPDGQTFKFSTAAVLDFVSELS